MRVAVVYATLGRPEIVAGATEFMVRQSRQPDQLIFSVVQESDVPAHAMASSLGKIVLGPKGLAAQRNTALREIGDSADIIVFFDDDFAPAPDYLEKLVAIFEGDNAIAGVTGRVVADGIGGPGLTFDDARIFLAEALAAPQSNTHRRVGSLYGCNMAFRRIFTEGLTFDERLPLYGWQEDVDYTVQLGRRGPLVKSDELLGVHLGVKLSRTPGLSMGYAQIANPIFLRTKRTMHLPHAYSLMMRNVAANLVRSIKPEPWCDRRGRLAGNFKAMQDFFRGRLDPRNILTLK